MRTWLGRLARDITRKIAGAAEAVRAAFATPLARIAQLLRQRREDRGRERAFAVASAIRFASVPLLVKRMRSTEGKRAAIAAASARSRARQLAAVKRASFSGRALATDQLAASLVIGQSPAGCRQQGAADRQHNPENGDEAGQHDRGGGDRRRVRARRGNRAPIGGCRRARRAA
jgi:hypothetical protein